jgi:hypothetical protein
MRLPAGNRAFPFEHFRDFFEALLTSFPVFVAGILHFHHGSAPFGHPQNITATDAPG